MNKEDIEKYSSVKPVFIKTKDIPGNEENPPAVIEVCLAGEKSAGSGSILGSQSVRGLWRIYPRTTEARTELLVKGLKMRGVIIQVANTNPFILFNNAGEEKPTTKLWVDLLPISVANSEIEYTLKKMGCELRSNITMEKARDADNKLTRFLTGRRFLFITVPETPLEKFVKINGISSKLYHREQKLNNRPLTCSRCLEQGHHASACRKDIVCRQCGLAGHKQGDADCCLPAAPTDNGTPEKTKNMDQTKEKGDNKKEKTPSAETQLPEKERRSRPSTRQTTIISSLERDQRDRERSATPGKRPHSRQRTSPRTGDKYRRLEPSCSPTKVKEQQQSDSPGRESRGEWR